MKAQTHRPIAFGVALGMLFAGASAQTTIHVATCGDDSWSGLSDVCQAPDGPRRSVQSAIDAGQDGDTVLVLPGVHTGAGNRNISFNGKTIALRSRDGAAATTFDLQGVLWGDEANFVNLHNAEGPGTVIEGFTVVNAASEESVIDMRGDATLALRGCEFESNIKDGTYGGILFAPQCDVTVESCGFHGPVLEGDHPVISQGGYIHAYNTDLTLRNCTFDGAWADWGGAVYFEGNRDDGPEDCVIEDCTFRNMTGRRGAGARVFYARVARVDGCTFEGNSVQMLYCDDGASDARGGAALIQGEEVYLTNSRIVRNSSEVWYCPDFAFADVGGIAVGATNLVQVSNCLIADNVADDADGQGRAGEVGGLRIAISSAGSAAITGCTISGNRARQAAAGLRINAVAPNVLIHNTVIYGNDGEEIDAPVQYVTVTHSDIEGGFSGDGNIDADPLFTDAANGDYRLAAGSPCIDAADNTSVPLGFPLDLAGEPRFRDDPATPDPGVGIVRVVDMGAYEFQPGPFCPADFDDDGVADTRDVLAFLNAWNAGEPTADANADGELSTLDVLAFLNQWNAGC